MDASLKFDNPGRASLARCFIWCVVPMLNSAAPQGAQTLLNCLKILAPRTDFRRLQTLVYFRLGQYVEAIQILNELENPESRALSVLCERALAEPSWWGGAQSLWESGDPDVRAMLAPWIGYLFEPDAETARTEPPNHLFNNLRA